MKLDEVLQEALGTQNKKLLELILRTSHELCIIILFCNIFNSTKHNKIKFLYRTVNIIYH